MDTQLDIAFPNHRVECADIWQGHTWVPLHVSPPGRVGRLEWEKFYFTNSFGSRSFLSRNNSHLSHNQTWADADASAYVWLALKDRKLDDLVRLNFLAKKNASEARLRQRRTKDFVLRLPSSRIHSGRGKWILPVNTLHLLSVSFSLEKKKSFINANSRLKLIISAHAWHEHLS